MNPFKSILIIFFLLANFLYASSDKKTIAYVVSDITIPFWDIMSKGMKNKAGSFDYNFKIYNSENNAKKELEATIAAIKDKVDGIVVSPTNSSACVTILKLAKRANIPVVIADIGTDAGEYVSYISSNNKNGAYNIGKVLAKKMIEKNWQDGKVGIIAIPQKRLNGQARTAGFMKALDEHGIKGADIKQLVKWTQEETYNYAKDMILKYPDLRAIWLQTSDKYKDAIKAINDLNKEDDVILLSFDAEPEFLQLIPKGTILASAMQQPYLMGQEAVAAMNRHFKGEVVEKNIQLPILIISNDNIKDELNNINLNVLGIEK